MLKINVYNTDYIYKDIINSFTNKLLSYKYEEYIYEEVNNVIDIKHIKKIIINKEDLKNSSTKEKITIISKALANSIPIYLNKFHDEEFENLCKDYDVKYYNDNTNELKNKINLYALTDMALGSILEIFENPIRKYNIREYSLDIVLSTININNNRIIIKEDYDLSITEENLFEAYKYAYKTRFINKSDILPVNDYNFRYSVYDKSILADCNPDNVFEDVISYKLNVFKSIKNIPLEDWSKIDRKLCHILNINNYIPLEKYKELEGEYK